MSAEAKPVTIHRLLDLETAGADGTSLISGIDRIFWATVARRPDDPIAAQAFKDLWLDQYLRLERDLAYVAVQARENTGTPDVVGYIVGCRVDPAQSTRFGALAYLKQFVDQCALYPAHLHINMDAAFRGRRIGEKLVEMLCSALAIEGIRGVHVVTGGEQRNVGFYTRLGFEEIARAPRGTSHVLFLGRKLVTAA